MTESRFCEANRKRWKENDWKIFHLSLVFSNSLRHPFLLLYSGIHEFSALDKTL
jgi:hypothetical protein